jgi:hypothetical protein
VSPAAVSTPHSTPSSVPRVDAEQVAVVPECEECGAVWLPADPEHWRLVLGDVDELVWLCAACWEHEFGGD